MFRRGHPETPIDPASVCSDRRQTVNLISAGGLAEQSNAAKNNAVDKLAGSAGSRLASWLAAGAAGGWLAGWLLADCWLTAGLLLLLLAGSLAGCMLLLASLLCYGCWLAGSLPGKIDAAVHSLSA